MPTFLDIEKEERPKTTSVKKTFLDIGKTQQTFLDVKPTKPERKERKPQEIKWYPFKEKLEPLVKKIKPTIETIAKAPILPYEKLAKTPVVKWHWEGLKQWSKGYWGAVTKGKTKDFQRLETHLSEEKRNPVDTLEKIGWVGFATSLGMTAVGLIKYLPELGKTVLAKTIPRKVLARRTWEVLNPTERLNILKKYRPDLFKRPPLLETKPTVAPTMAVAKQTFLDVKKPTIALPTTYKPSITKEIALTQIRGIMPRIREISTHITAYKSIGGKIEPQVYAELEKLNDRIHELMPVAYPGAREPEMVTDGAGVSTVQQKAQAHILAKKILWISEKGKVKPSYKRFAMVMTGKRSMKEMTQEEADYFIDSLKRLKLRSGGRPPRIPTSAFMITKDFADKIPVLGEIGAIERVRETKRVFAKMGLEKEIWVPAFETEVKAFEDQQAFRHTLSLHRKAVEKAGGTPQRVFRLLEKTATKEEQKLATPEEHQAVEWLRKHYDSWADRLNIPHKKRMKNYITHIFEKEIVEAYREKRPIDPDLIRALDFITPKTIFMPYLQERMGQNIGLKEDAWMAASAYEARALKVFHYEPLIKRIRIYEKFLPPNSAKYLRSFITRITSRPLVIDRELKQNLTEMANVIEKLPHGNIIANYLKRGNPAALLSYNMTGILYEAFLGFRPLSAIKNLSQKSLTIAECGITNFAKARVWKHTAEGRRVLKESLMLRSRKLGYLPGVDETFIAKLDSKRRKVSMYMFRLADKDNVTDAFATGYLEAKRLGLPHELAIKRGDEVAHKTQYLYTKLAGSQFMQTSPGRVLGVLTTWPRNWVELMLDWVKGKPSQVYLDYQKATGKRILPEGLLMKRKALLRYLAIVATAMYVQKKTRFKALYYTGWTSLASFARMAKGEFAGLDIPGSVAMLVAGTMTADQPMIKKAWNRLRPDRLVIIARELSDILLGKKDWLSLFFILKRTPKYSAERAARELRE